MRQKNYIEKRRATMDSVGKCNICNEIYTESHVEIMQGTTVYVCSSCIEQAEDSFIWLCMTCGKTFIKPKDLVINRIKDHELKRAYMLCEDMQIIQGIDECFACDPDRMLEYMETEYAGIEC